MNSRDTIFSSIRKALAPLPADERTAYPDWDDALPVRHQPPANDLWTQFAENCRAVNGTPVDGLKALGEWMASQELTTGYCDPALAPMLAEVIPETVTLLDTFDRADADRYQFGITRAAAAIAESGSIVLAESRTSSRLAALAPWVHIAILEPEDVVPDVLSAIRRFGDDPNTIFVTGPSKTADVEGILIEGVHGPGVQVCCRIRSR